MVITKIINNNVITALDQNQQELVIMGKGIGFQAKAGQNVDESKVEKRFVMDSSTEMGRFSEMIQSIPLEYLQASMDIIDYAAKVLCRRLSNSIYISLTDHLNFALERFKTGLLFGNPLVQEVRSFYPSEYLIGEYALGLVKRDLGVMLPLDEAASIALHFVNAEYNTDMSSTIHIATLLRQMVDLIEKEFTYQLDELDIHYSRFITHLKFLASRVVNGQHVHYNEDELTQMVQGLYRKEYEIARKLLFFLEKEYGYKLSEEELVYLTLHIRRIQKN